MRPTQLEIGQIEFRRHCLRNSIHWVKLADLLGGCAYCTLYQSDLLTVATVGKTGAFQSSLSVGPAHFLSLI